jgi:hypothetical protein
VRTVTQNSIIPEAFPNRPPFSHRREARELPLPDPFWTAERP